VGKGGSEKLPSDPESFWGKRETNARRSETPKRKRMDESTGKRGSARK